MGIEAQLVGQALSRGEMLQVVKQAAVQRSLQGVGAKAAQLQVPARLQRV